MRGGYNHSDNLGTGFLTQKKAGEGAAVPARDPPRWTSGVLSLPSSVCFSCSSFPAALARFFPRKQCVDSFKTLSPFPPSAKVI